jgi:hypothetical protein
MEQLTHEQAIELYKNEFWKSMSFRERAEFQMSERKLCMPFDIFHEALEKTLGRSVYTQEFALNFQGLKDELFSGKKPPTLEEIIKLIPSDKLIVIGFK